VPENYKPVEPATKSEFQLEPAAKVSIPVTYVLT